MIYISEQITLSYSTDTVQKLTSVLIAFQFLNFTVTWNCYLVILNPVLN